MGNLEQRIRKLEQATNDANEHVVLIINMAGDNVTGFRSGDSVIYRLPGESVVELTERATQEWISRVHGSLLVLRSI